MVGQERLWARAAQVRLVLTDCDGVLTDGGVFYSSRGEEMKRFSVRDGMGVERLRKLVQVDVGIITGETLEALRRRAEKLAITELYLGTDNKSTVLDEILERRQLLPEEVAFIGDDCNDVDVMVRAGLSACPNDADLSAKAVADYVCRTCGGHGAFREFAELIIGAKLGIRMEQGESEWTIDVASG